MSSRSAANVVRGASITSNDVQIRTGQPADARRIAILASQVWLHTYARDGINDEIADYSLSELTVEKFSASLGEHDTMYLVAECGECIVGFAAIRLGAACPSISGPTVELQTLYVQAHFIGLGIGRALLQAAEMKAHSLSASPLWLTVNAQNEHAMDFYARQGYSKIGLTHFVLGQARHENLVFVGSISSIER